MEEMTLLRNAEKTGMGGGTGMELIRNDKKRKWLSLTVFVLCLTGLPVIML